MKILIIAATPFFADRGCHIRIYNGAKYLKKFGSVVKICTYFSGRDVDDLDIERIKKVSWYKRTSPGFSWGKFWLDIKLIFLCRRVIRDFRPDVIHAHLYEGLGVGYVAKRLAGINVPMVVDLQADLDEEFRNYNRNNFIARKFFVWLSKRLINRCDWLVLSSENVLPYAERLFKRKDRISIIRDGIDLDIFRNVPKLDGEEQKKIEEIKKWKGDKKLLVYIGGLSDNKGVWELLKAFPRREWKLLIGGFGENEEKYKRYVEENDLKDFVHFVGRVNYFSLPHYLDLADAAIDPKNSSSEASGKLVNLMAAGLPIICFDNDFNRSRLGERGFYMKNFDELENVLIGLERISKMDYKLEEHNEEIEARKLLEIMNCIVDTQKV